MTEELYEICLGDFRLGSLRSYDFNGKVHWFAFVHARLDNFDYQVKNGLSWEEGEKYALSFFPKPVRPYVIFRKVEQPATV